VSNCLHRTTVSELYRNESLSVHKFTCNGEPDRCAGETSISSEIVLPRDGMFVRHNRYGKSVADRASVLFFERDDPFEISHPVKKPDTNTVVSLNRRLISELCTLPGQDSSPFFGVDSILATNRILLAHYELLSAIQRQITSDQLELEEKALLLVAEVFDQLRKRSVIRERSAKRPGLNGRKLVNEVLLYLNENFGNPLSLGDIAAAANRSRFYLCRVFRSHTGRTIHRHLTGLRLSSALETLAYTQTPITDIALDLGYSSHSHFAARFKREFGITPKKYRDRS
jgi:AraC family transcriptional regulator